jgi:4-amino-4-deoxy-L-arabinose transferase-like glycosyltransferase
VSAPKAPETARASHDPLRRMHNIHFCAVPRVESSSQIRFPSDILPPVPRRKGIPGARHSVLQRVEHFEMRRALESLWIIVLVGLLLRLVVVAFVYQDLLSPDMDHWSFGWETGRIARSLTLGEGFANPLFHKTGLTAWMAPAYPWLLACVFRLAGIYTKASALGILSLNCLFSALTSLPVYYLARNSLGTAVAAPAAWFWGLFPYAFDIGATRVWDTCLSALLLTTLLALTVHLVQARSPGDWAAYAVVWGIAALTNPALLSVFPWLVGWVCYRLHNAKRDWVKPCSLCVLLVLVIVSPWMVRNYRVFHRFIPLRDNFWLEMWVGNNGDTSDWFPIWVHPTGNDQELAEFERLGEIGYMDQKRAQTVAFIRSHPGPFLLAIFRRLLFTWTGFWSFNRHYLAENAFDPPNIFFSSSLTILMLLGLWRIFCEAPAFAVPFAIVLFIYPVVYYLTHAAIYYRHPIDPEIVVLAVLGLHRGFHIQDLRQDHPRKSEPGSELHMPA